MDLRQPLIQPLLLLDAVQIDPFGFDHPANQVLIYRAWPQVIAQRRHESPHLAVYMRHPPGGIAKNDAQRQPIQRLGKAPVALGLASFGLAAARNVANETGKALTLIEFDLTDRQLDGEDRPVFAFRGDLPAYSDDPPLACPEISCDISVMLGRIGFRHQIGDVPADDLVGGIAEQPLRRLVEGTR